MERWRGTVAIAPHERRVMTVTDDTLVLADPAERVGPLRFDLRDLADNGVLLVGETTMTLVDRGAPEPNRLQLRAFDPPTFDAVDWPADVREAIEEQRAASAAARAKLTRQLGLVVATTIAGLALLLLVLVVVLLLA